MPIYKRNDSDVWFIDITSPSGKRIRRSTKTTIKREAQELHDKIKSELWRINKLDEKPRYTWKEAVMRYTQEKSNIPSYDFLISNLRILDKYLGELFLDEITKETISDITQSRLKSTYDKRKGGKKYSVSTRTVNAMLSVLGAVLNMAKNEWEWIDSSPRVRLVKLQKHEKIRDRSLTKIEVKTLLDELPIHLRQMARFTLATGLREYNVTHLTWERIDIDNKQLWVTPEDSKNGHYLAIPLNDDAMEILRQEQGKHPTRVFTYKGKPIKRANSAAWSKALDRAGIAPYILPDTDEERKRRMDPDYKPQYPSKPLESYKYKDFRWHDLRHVWASWHIQSGTPLPVLQRLGGWKTAAMVERYAHLGESYISKFKNNILLYKDDA